jgi:DNA topoisomerase-1
VTVARAQEIIDEKQKADAPIATYKGEGVQKGVGRFGPFIKWNGLFINVSKKYNFDNLSQQDVEELIEDKLQKNIDKIIHNWEAEGIMVEKARWGKSVITKGKIKIELNKDIDAAKLTLDQVKEMIEQKTPAKKTAAKKATTKKPAAKKATAKKATTTKKK